MGFHRAIVEKTARVAVKVRRRFESVEVVVGCLVSYGDGRDAQAEAAIFVTVCLVLCYVDNLWCDGEEREGQAESEGYKNVRASCGPSTCESPSACSTARKLKVKNPRPAIALQLNYAIQCCTRDGSMRPPSCTFHAFSAVKMAPIGVIQSVHLTSHSALAAQSGHRSAQPTENTVTAGCDLLRAALSVACRAEGVS